MDISNDIVITQAQRVREIVEHSDYSLCPVPAQREVLLFLVDGMTAILKTNGRAATFGAAAGGASAVLLLVVTEIAKRLLIN